MTESLLLALADAGVEFVLIGGMAAVAQGVPYATHDVDIVHHRGSENVGRLLAFLHRHDAVHRPQFGRRVVPTAQQLAGAGTVLTQTDLGQLDLLGSIADGRDYDALLPYTITLHVASRAVRVLRLDELVAIKRASEHDKDKAQLPGRPVAVPYSSPSAPPSCSLVGRSAACWMRRPRLDHQQAPLRGLGLLHHDRDQPTLHHVVKAQRAIRIHDGLDGKYAG